MSISDPNNIMQLQTKIYDESQTKAKELSCQEESTIGINLLIWDQQTVNSQTKKIPRPRIQRYNPSSGMLEIFLSYLLERYF